ncbi:arginine--tRNA ligase [Candidatus Endowatersipora endosymbiont of Watersipora subatra]|uniref:arginine--tRNA ligase n=1 Tax=Candidatus Endowatersipora endosymbiont of Watersipora subatra TaxID=3077946 RepID=UPI00312CB89D
MSNLYKDLESSLKKKLKFSLFREVDDLDVDAINVETPRHSKHGHFSTNAAMVLAKQLRRSTKEIAEEIASDLLTEDHIISVDVAGPGFINICFSDIYWSNHLVTILDPSFLYGSRSVGHGTKVNIEYVSANPTGPMHVGHCRGAVVGDALANLLEFSGFDVTREYYINDAGGQIEVLARSVFMRYRDACCDVISELSGDFYYSGSYLLPVAEDLRRRYGNSLLKMSEKDWYSIVKEFSINAMMGMIRSDLDALGVRHDIFFSESSLHLVSPSKTTPIAEAIKVLSEADLIYEGTLPPPKKKSSENWEDRQQLLFRSTNMGDDIDRALIKSNGDYTYFAADVGYFKDKFDRGFKEMILILGADHNGYVKRMNALSKAISGGKARLSICLCQLVKLYRDGEPVKMSKRSGNFITLREVVDEVGSDAVRFMMLYRKNDAPLDFDFSRVNEQNKDNPVFYVQYAYARCCSIFRQASQELGINLDTKSLQTAKVELLKAKDELALIRKLAEFPKVIDVSSRTHEPHRVAFYLYELAALFHGHWSKGISEPKLRYINTKSLDLTVARLSLVQGIRNVIASGLRIIGVSQPQEMH